VTVGAHFQINQATNAIPTGTVDVARNDVRYGATAHTVGDSSSGQTSPVWLILAWPAGSARNQPTNRTTFDATYGPTVLDVPGSYLVDYVVNDGSGAINGTNSNHRQFVIRCTQDPNGLIVDDGVAEPAFGELVTHDNTAGNDRGYAKTFEAGMGAQVPSIATMADLINRRPNRHKQIHLLNFATAGDGGGGPFRWDAASTAPHNGGTIIQPGFGTGAAMATGRWMRQFTGAIHAQWFGVDTRRNRRFVTGSLTIGSNVLTLNSGAADYVPLTQDDVGLNIILRTPQSPLPSGTAGTFIGTTPPYQINGVGTHYTTDIPNHVGAPDGGGAIYTDGQWFTISNVGSDTSLTVNQPPTRTISGLALYRETQLKTTIQTVNDATHAVLAVSGGTILVSDAAVEVVIEKDNTDAFDAGFLAAIALGVEYKVPAGRISLSHNLNYVNQNKPTIVGAGIQKTIISLCQICSTNPAPSGFNFGLLSFNNCPGLKVHDLGFDTNVPVMGITLTPPGFGTKKGLWIYQCADHDIHIGSAGRGSRDEYLFVNPSVGYPNGRIWGCNILTASVALNPAGGELGTVIENNTIMAGNVCCELEAKSAILTGNKFSIFSDNGFATGGTPVVIIPTAGCDIAWTNNTVRDGNISTAGNSVIEILGTIADDAASVITFQGNRYVGVRGLFDPTGGAVILSDNFKGKLHVRGETIEGCSASVTGGRHLVVRGANTADVTIASCKFGGDGGSNMTNAVTVDATVPDGRVTDLGGHSYGPSVTTRLTLGAKLVAARETVTI
jgi:hypothetical protein